MKGHVLAEGLGIGFVRWDVRKDRLWWSPGMYALLGQDPEQCTPSVRAMLQLLEPMGRAEVTAAMSQALENREPFSFDHQVMVDGEVRVLEVRGVIDTTRDGHPRRMHCLVRDITAGRQRR